MNMTSESEVRIERTRNFALTRLYYDANSYIAGTVETLSEVQAHPNYLNLMANLPNEAARQGRHEGEEAMAILLSRWNPQLAFVSLHTLLEMLDVATRRYGIPLQRAIDLIIDGIDRDFTLLPAEFEMVRPSREIIQRIEAKLPEAWEYAKVRYRAMARDAEGKELGMVSMGEVVTSGAGHITIQGGSPETFKAAKSLDTPQSHTIRDAKFERELFLGAAQIAFEHNIHAADALHVLYCMGGGMVLVTSDAKLLGRFPRAAAGLPHALTPIAVLRTWGRFLCPPASGLHSNSSSPPGNNQGR